MFNDEFAGQGGSYIIGADGKRARVEETVAAVPTETISQPVSLVAPADPTEQTVKAEV